jgi:hypothetical protein
MPAGTFAVTTMTWCRAVLCGSKPNTGQTQAEQAPRADMSKQTCSLPLSLQHIPVTWKFCEGQQTLGVQLICHFSSPSHTEAAWERPCKLPAVRSRREASGVVQLHDQDDFGSYDGTPWEQFYELPKQT